MNKNRPLFALVVPLSIGLAGIAAAQNPIPPPPARAPTSRNTASTTPPPAPDASAPPAAPVIPPASTSTASASGDYVLASADSVEMTVFHQPDLTTQAKIANDGSVQFPLIGELKIGGLTLRDARELIRKRYNADYLVEPQVYLNVVTYAARKFTILGQVTTPGTYVMPGGEHVGLMEAVGMAGGFTRIADRGKVVIKRSDHGKQQTFNVNTKKFTTQDGKQFELMPGDVVTIGETWL